jgi:AICAR transformylase/IMP cyclohydrolase PurH
LIEADAIEREAIIKNTAKYKYITDTTMKEFELKYGCNPNQKPARIYMADGMLPECISGRSTHICP